MIFGACFDFEEKVGLEERLSSEDYEEEDLLCEDESVKDVLYVLRT